MIGGSHSPVTRSRNQRGFTLVELLIVIVVIAILAAISVVAYNGIQGRAHDTAIKSDLSMVKKKLEIARVNNGRYPANLAELPTDVTLSKGAYTTAQNNAYLCVDTVGDKFAFGAASKSGSAYTITSDSAIEERTGISFNATCDLINAVAGEPGIYIRAFYYINIDAWMTPWNG